MNENLCTNRSEKTLIVHWERNTPTENRLTIAEHNILWFKRRKKGLFNRKLRRGEANFLGKEVISCFALMYRDRLGLVSTDLK